QIVQFLLFLVLSSEATVHYSDIDLDRCSWDTICFYRDSCAGPPPSNLKLTPKWGDFNDCDVIVQVKPFTNSKFLIFLRVKSSETGQKLEKDFGITL
ncbi:hypothetical protein PFISCL1PPCAC_4245, partial [Pristionchus fissidentatus]